VETVLAIGRDVSEARRATEALRALERTDAPPDLVMSDVVMPEMSGPELHRTLRAKGLDPRILFTSGYPVTDASERRQIEAEYPFIAKPWEMRDLLGKVREVLEAPPVTLGAPSDVTEA
jgi:two-component system cell cycle sensor histidine kinase/response regulator CckA